MIAERNWIWEKKHIPTPMRPDDRLLLVNAHGNPITRHALSSIWQTLMLEMIEAGIITADQRFGVHDSKRQGVTETKGNRGDKKEASGHRTDSQLDIYDLSLPHVSTPGDV